MRSISRVPLATALALALALTPAAAPAQTTARVSAVPCPGAEAGGCGDTVEVRFLGAGGFLVRHGEDAVITGPLFSNPPLPRVLLPLAIAPDPRRIEEGMSRLLPDRQGIHAVLVGHSHYDHLMDVPYISHRYLPAARIYGNNAMLNLLAWDTALVRRMESVEGRAGSREVRGEWFYPKAQGPARTGTRADSTVRIMAVVSEHATHALGLIKIFKRDQTTPRTTPPRTADDWAQGQTHAYVVEFRDPATLRMVFRFQYQDATARPPFGFPPRMEGRYDLALVCGGNYEQVRDGSYPGSLLAHLNPRHAIIGHWEDFFHSQGELVRKIPALELGELVRRVRQRVPGGEVAVPVPGQSMRFCVCPPGAP